MKQVKMTKKRKAFLYAMVASALLLHTPAMSHAEEAVNEYSFEQVVVTATKTPVKVSEANANITIVTQEDIQKKRYQDLSEVLRDVPGVNLAIYGGGVGYERSTGLRINGSDKVVVLIDGVRVNVAGEPFQVTSYNGLGNVERIEVLKGAASALYGSDAKGGVINIITRKVDKAKTTLTLSGGSFDQENYSFLHQGKEGDYTWLINTKKDIIGNYKDGNRTEVPQHKNADTNTFKITKKLDDKSDVTFFYDQYKADGFYYTFKNNTNQLNVKKSFTNDNYNWRMIYNYQFSDKARNQLSYYNNSFDETYDGSRTYIKTIGIQDQYTQKIGDKHLVTAGFDFSRDEAKTSYYTATLYNRAIYMQDEWNIDDKWNFTSGVRSDWHTGYDTSVTPKATLGYKQNKNTNYYLSYNEYFIAPTPYQLYNDTYGNNNLKAEEGKSVELGMNHKFDDTTTAQFHVFKRDSTNVVGWVYADGKYHNFDEKAHGWDIQLNKRLSPQLATYMGYTRTIIDPTQERTANVDGYVPKGVWNVGLDYEQGKYAVSLNGQGISDRQGPRDSYAYADYFPKTSYWIWNAAVNYKAGKDMTVFVKANNLFDVFYAEHSGSTSRPYWGGAEKKWWTSPGRSYQVGIQYQF